MPRGWLVIHQIYYLTNHDSAQKLTFNNQKYYLILCDLVMELLISAQRPCIISTRLSAKIELEKSFLNI